MLLRLFQSLFSARELHTHTKHPNNTISDEWHILPKPFFAGRFLPRRFLIFTWLPFFSLRLPVHFTLLFSHLPRLHHRRSTNPLQLNQKFVYSVRKQKVLCEDKTEDFKCRSKPTPIKKQPPPERKNNPPKLVRPPTMSSIACMSSHSFCY